MSVRERERERERERDQKHFGGGEVVQQCTETMLRKLLNFCSYLNTNDKFFVIIHVIV